MTHTRTLAATAAVLSLVTAPAGATTHRPDLPVTSPAPVTAAAAPGETVTTTGRPSTTPKGSPGPTTTRSPAPTSPGCATARPA